MNKLQLILKGLLLVGIVLSLASCYSSGRPIWETPTGVDEKRCAGKCDPKCKTGSSCKLNLLNSCRCFSDKTGDPTNRLDR